MKVGDLVKLKGFPPLGANGPQDVGRVGVITRIGWKGCWILLGDQLFQYAKGSLEVISESR